MSVAACLDVKQMQDHNRHFTMLHLRVVLAKLKMHWTSHLLAIMISRPTHSAGIAVAQRNMCWYVTECM